MICKFNDLTAIVEQLYERSLRDRELVSVLENSSMLDYYDGKIQAYSVVLNLLKGVDCCEKESR